MHMLFYSIFSTIFSGRGYNIAVGNVMSGSASGANQPRPSSAVDRDDYDNCRRCGTRVYHAEQVLALSRKWHKLCFKCGEFGD